MNQLRAELKKWAKRTKETPKQCESNLKPLRLEPAKPPKQGRELVAGGDILWKPVNREAAKLLSRSSWLSQPPETNAPIPIVARATTHKDGNQDAKKKNPKSVQRKVDENRPAPKVSGAGALQKARTKQKPKTAKWRRNILMNEVHSWSHGSTKPELKTDAEQYEDVEKELIKRTAKAIADADELTRKSIDARLAMDMMAEQYKMSWVTFSEESGKRLNDLRMTRMATEGEMRQLMGALREVRAFFLDKDHEPQMARLREFVEVCERLKALKESGFLDSVADTILKLA